MRLFTLSLLITGLMSKISSAWMASTFFHSCLLLILGCFYWQLESDPGQTLFATTGPQVVSPEINTIATIQDSNPSGSSQAEVPVNQTFTSVSNDLVVPEVKLKNPEVLQQILNPLFSAEELTTPVRSNIRDLSGLRYLAGLNQGDGTGGSGNGSGSFLGTLPTYRKIVYVVDSSLSMNHRHDSPALTRMGRVKVELLRSIEGLQDHQEFFIIFFSHESHPMKTTSQFITKNSPLLEKSLIWVAEHLASGDTDPRASLQMAFEMEPEVIFFLTDGEVHPIIARDILNFNQNKVKINTICIGNAPSEKLMQAIARIHHGTYTFVP